MRRDSVETESRKEKGKRLFVKSNKGRRNGEEKNERRVGVGERARDSKIAGERR